jgi:flavin-dependent dehydrogenase
LLLDKSWFPREKVCGDCLNPLAWPVLDRLGIAAAVRALPHATLRAVEFIDLNGETLTFSLPEADSGEIAVKRRHLDQLLLNHAAAAGAVVRTGEPVHKIASGWRIQTPCGEISSTVLVAADGRNSTVARLQGLLPAAGRDRLALQTHLPLPPGRAGLVALRLFPEGYCGFADAGDGQLNLCLVSTASKMISLKMRVTTHFNIPESHPWQSTAPLARRPVRACIPNLLLVGDAARVVEPFTGEGISYALASGELAAVHIDLALKSGAPIDLRAYWTEHRRLYRGRLWVNELAKAAVLRPQLGHALLRLMRVHPLALRLLTSKVVRVAQP